GKGASLVVFESGDTVEDLASSTAGKGAALVTMEGGGTAQAAIIARPTSTTLAASGGSALLGFLQSGTGAVARTAQGKLRDVVSLADFTGIDMTGTADSATGLTNAVADGRALKCP